MSCLRMLCFGDNEHHQLGIHTTTDIKRRNIILSVMHPSQLMVAGSQLLVHDHNSFWGKEEQEQCKVHTINTTTLFNKQTIRKVVCGSYRTFFITDSYKVFCCGSNDFKNLPVSFSNNPNAMVDEDVSTPHKKYIECPTFCDLLTEDVVDIVCGYFYNIYIGRRTLTLLANGNNSFGQCSVGDSYQKSIARPLYVDLSNLKNTSKEIVQISCGTNHTLLLTNDKKVYVTGSPDGGKLGFDPNDSAQDMTEDFSVNRFKLLTAKKIDAKTIQVQAGANWSLFLTEDGGVYASGQSKLFVDAVYAPTLVTTVTPVSRIISGAEHAFFIFNDAVHNTSQMTGFGRFMEGQLGQRIPSARDKIDGTSMKDVPLPKELASNLADVSVGGYHTICISNNNDIYVTGSDIMNQLGYYLDEMRENPLSEPIVTNLTKLQRYYTYQDLNVSKLFNAKAVCGEVHTFIYFTSDKHNSVTAHFSIGFSSTFNDIDIISCNKSLKYQEIFPNNRHPLEGPTKKKKVNK